MSQDPSYYSNYPRAQSNGLLPIRPSGVYWDSINLAANLIKQEPLPYILGGITVLVVYFGLTLCTMLIGSMVAYGNPMGWMTQQPPSTTYTVVANGLSFLMGGFYQALMGGFVAMMFSHVQGEKPTIGTIFSKFNRLPKFFALHLLYLLAFIPALIVVGLVAALIAPLLGPIVAFLIVAILAFGLFLFITGPLTLLPAIGAMEDLSPIESIKSAFERTKGSSLSLSVLIFVAALIGGIGSIACCIGLIYTVPLYMLIIGVQYFYFSPFNIPATHQTQVEMGQHPPTY